MNPKAQKSGFINQVSSRHEPPEPSVSRKPTPAEALELKIKLPWEGKVQRVHHDSLTKELFLALENYGLTRREIADLFNVYAAKLFAKLTEWGVPKGKPCVQNKAAREANTEGKGKPIDLSLTYHDTAPGRERKERIATKPGQTQEQAARVVAAEDEDGLNYQDKHNLWIQDTVDTSGWEIFDLRDTHNRNRSLIVGVKKLYVGIGVKFIASWERVCVKVRPDGKQIALEKTDSTGYKVGKDHNKPAITCKPATEMLKKTVGTGKEFLPIIEREDLLVFEMRETQ